MPRLKSVTDANGTKIYPVTITRGVYDTDKNQRLNETLANKAEIGTVADAKTVSSLYGAKAYSKDLVDTSEYKLRNLSAILAFATGTGTVTLSTNPEWKLILLDYTNKILLGKRRDNTWYLPMNLDDLLDSVIVDYGN
jgi:hypothetical protein